MKGLFRTINNPCEVRIHKKNKNELHFIRKLKFDNQIIILILNITDSVNHPDNSIMSSWIINDSRLNGFRKRSRIIYRRHKKWYTIYVFEVEMYYLI